MFVLLVSLVIPGVFRIALNRAPFSGDESQYARASVELFRKLRSSPSGWPQLLMTISPYKPSALVWIGQFFVPLGSSVGSIDRGLLLCTLCIQTLTLALLAVALWEISAQRLGQSMLIVLISASAPSFVALGSYFLVESAQTLVAAWFIFVMARARVWPPAFTLGLLFLGSMFAPLTKQTTPLFCIWPGLVALLCALHRARTRHYWGWQTRAVKIALIAGVLQATATSMWYWTNWRNNIAYVTTFTRGPIAAIWGKEDTFLGTLSYWVGTFPSTLILPVVVPVALGLVVSAIFHRVVTGRDEAGSYFTVCAFAALLQVVTVLIVFSFSANRELRYVLPLLPSVSLVLCWSVAHFGKRWVTGLAVIAFAGQLGLVWGYTFGVFSPDVHIVVQRIDRDGQNARLLTTITLAFHQHSRHRSGISG
jgi:hypothetical protein